MRLNFACGSKPLTGFFNIDAVNRDGAKIDLIYVAEFHADGELKAQVPLEDGCAQELHSFHFLEHIFRWEADAMVREWARLLRPGGKLVLELPNVLLAAKNLLAGARDQMWLWPMVGDPSHKDPYMMHKHVYHPSTVQELLEANGFESVKHCNPQTHRARINRDMRVEAVKT